MIQKKLNLIIFLFLIIINNSISFSQTKKMWEFLDTNKSMDYKTSVNYFNIKTIDAKNENDIILCSKIISPKGEEKYLRIQKITNKGNDIEEIFRMNLNSAANDHSWHSVAHPSKDLIIVIGDSLFDKEKKFQFKHFGQIIISRDGGINWEIKTLDSNFSLMDISMLNENFGIILSDYFGDDKDFDYILITKDGWKTFEKIPLPDDYILKKIHCFSESKYAILCYDKNEQKDLYMITTDKGQNWNKVHYFKERTLLSEIKFLDDNTIYALGRAEFVPDVISNFLYRSDDGGYNWSRITTMFNKDKFEDLSFFALDFFDKNNGIISTSIGSVLITTDGGVTWVEEIVPYCNSLYMNSYLNLRQIYYPDKDFAIGVSPRAVLKRSNKKMLITPKVISLPFQAYQPVDSVTFSWTDVVGAISYRVKITKSGVRDLKDTFSFESPFIDTLVSSNSMTLKNLDYYSYYVGFIKALGDGIESNWSKQQYFFTTLKDGHNLIKTDIIEPENNSLNIPSEVTIKWRKVPDATHYYVYIWYNDYNDAILWSSDNDYKDTVITLSGLIPNRRFVIGIKTAYDEERTKFTYSAFFTGTFSSVEEKYSNFENFLIYPNPVSSEFNVKLNSCCDTKARIEIFNILGVKVFEKMRFLSQGENQFDINAKMLSSGQYFVIVKTKKIIYSETFIKRE